jgi:hypothetical protein
MPFRTKDPVTIICEQCGERKTLKYKRKKVVADLCSRKCSSAWFRNHDAMASWRLMELTRLLWESRPKGFKFEPREFPGLPAWRRELNATAKWIAELQNAPIH